MFRNCTFAALVIILLSIAACKKDDPVPVNPVTTDSTVFVICEGSLGNGNASLGIFNFQNHTAHDDVFESANGFPLGDVFQSMTEINGKYFLCVNNSDKIFIVDKNTFLVDGTISIAKPRYIQQVTGSKAYVSSIFSNRLFEINTDNYTITDTILLPAKNSEGLLLQGAHLLVACWDTTNTAIYSINTADNAVSTFATLAYKAPQDIVRDKNNRLWVLSGNASEGYTAAFTVLNNDGSIFRTLEFPAGVDPLRPVFNSSRDTLYFIEANYTGGSSHNGIYRMGIDATTLPEVPFINAPALTYYWALGIQPQTGYIYAGNPLGFTQRGLVSIYRQDGSLADTFRTGIGPGHFFFPQ